MHGAGIVQPQHRVIDAGAQAEIIDAKAECAVSAVMLSRTMSLRFRSVTQRANQGRIAWFLLVGCGAAAIHWTVVVGLVSHGAWQPLTANVVGWLTAFLFSFAGHHRLTFRDRRVLLRTAAPRFFAISAGGFALNESAYALLLGFGLASSYQWVLLAVLIGVAGVTYLLSRHWAFLGNPAP